MSSTASSKSSNPIDMARNRALQSLASGEQLHQAALQHAQSSEAAATHHHSQTVQQLPTLAAAVESVQSLDDKDRAQRAYLAAVQDHANSEQAFQLARRQQLQLGSDLSVEKASNAIDKV